MTNELAWVETLPAVGELAQKIAGTEFVPKAFRGNVAAVAACILTGHELGIGPMTALRGIIVINGRVTMSSEMLGARVFAAGHKLEWKMSTDTEAVVTLTRGDGLGKATASFTMDMARAAGLASHENYRKYPAAMLRARALTAVVGMAAPDVSLGLESHTETTDPPVPPTTTIRIPVEPPEKTVPRGAYPQIEPPKPVVRQETDPITRDQITLIMVLLAKTGRKFTRDERLAYIAELAGRPLDSTGALTKSEASKIIDTLTQSESRDPSGQH